MRAIRTNPKAPDYSALGAYMRHADESFGLVATPTFDKYVTETQRTQAQFWKQDRLYKEETVAASKKKSKKKKGEGKGKEDE